MDSLTMIWSYLRNCKQNVLVNNSGSITQTVNATVIQGSIRGPLLFNFLSNESVLFIQYAALGSYAGVINLFETWSNVKDLKRSCLHTLGKQLNGVMITTWSNILVSVRICAWVKKSFDNDILSLNELNLRDSDEWIILGITIDQKLKFKKHNRKLCIKTDQKLRRPQWLNGNDRKLV